MAIDITGADSKIYGVTCRCFSPLMVTAIPKFTDGRLTLVAKNKYGKPLQSRVEAIAIPARVTPDLLPQTGTSIDVETWLNCLLQVPCRDQGMAAIMAICSTTAAVAGELPIVPTDARANEPRFIRVG